ncbi:MAG TPA: alpha/beta family hydrolase [Acidimicrobiales bacterium]|nr:alpha/beta family hydrolase [Acidimicrobiales bacterium]
MPEAPKRTATARSERPHHAPVAGLVLAPGASAGRDQPALVSIDAAVAEAGITSIRIDFPYRLAGRRAPDRPPILMATIRDAAAELAAATGAPPGRIALGGRSMGGRMCSMAVAEGLPAAALVLVSYPLHPPGKPDRLRTEHFPALSVPCLFVSGTRDAFGTVGELMTATKAILGAVTHVWIEGGDHGLRGKDEEVAGVTREWLVGLCR